MFWLLCSILLGFGAAHAQSTQYVYDANGRVVAVTAKNGSSVQYSYDTLGHASQISAPLSAGQLAIFAFTPTHGEAPIQVTIQGQGFDANVANDTVSFNGVVATVISASATQLITMVPSGATTGPISVTADGQTTLSATPFVIDDTGAPNITQVSPVVVSAGGTITVSGTHLDPIAGETSVEFGNFVFRNLSAISDTQLQFSVPSNGASGYVTVDTPYGSATSPTAIAVLPASISASSVVSSSSATVDGSAVSLNIGASGQLGAITFAAPQSGWVSLQATAIVSSASSISYTLYSPNNTILQQGAISTSSPSIHLPHLAAGAPYLVIFQPNGAGAQMTVAAQSNALLGLSNAATVVTTVPGASTRLIFNATAGQNLAFLINGVSTNPSGDPVTYTVYWPNGSSYISGITRGTGVINLGNLPTAGTYQVVIAPGSGATGAIQVEIAPGVTGTLTGTAQKYTANVAGENIYLSFTATQGENLELTLNGVSDAGGTSNQFPVAVYNAAGATVASFTCYTSNPGQSCTQHLWYLPAGTYSVVASASYGGVLSLNAMLEEDLNAGAIAVNSTANIALAAGQVARYTFNANAGDTVALNVAGLTTTPAAQGLAFSVYRPDAGAITTNTPAYTSFTTPGAATANLPYLPVSGTYTVIVAPNYGLPSTGQVSIVGGVTATLPTNGSSQSYSAHVAGENVYFSFTATAGENLELVFNNVSNAGGQQNQFPVYVYNAAGMQVATFSCYASNPGQSCSQSLWDLPAGNYSVTVAQPYAGGVLSFNVSLQPDIVGPAITANSPVNFALGAGQVERYTFNANAGDTVALSVSGLTTTPTGQGVTFQVYRPDAGAITTTTTAYTTFSPTGGQTANLPNLPVSGAYTVIVIPSYGLAASGQLNLVPGATGTPSTNGTSQSYSANTAGENVYLTFNATQGQNLELVLNNVNDTGASSNQFTVSVYNAVGTQVASFWCYASNPGASCSQHLWDLVAGSYTVIAVPNYGGVISFNASILPDIAGPALTDNSPVAISLSAGQVERYTFNANAGDTIALSVTGVTTTPAGQGITFQVYRPDAGVITSGTPYSAGTSAYTSFTPTSSQTVNLANLPVTGTYTIIVSPNYGLAGSAQLNVVSGATGALSTSSTSQSYSANTAGQNIYLSFNATPGQNLELTVNNVNVVGGQNNMISVAVYNPTGNQIAQSLCYASNPAASCSQHLWSLSAGQYTVVASPSSGGVISFNALIEPDITGPSIQSGNNVSISLNAGQVERYTFNANEGDTVTLATSAIATVPAGQNVTFAVYRPDEGLITTSTGTYASFNPSGAQTVTLSNVPISGTYTLIVAPSYGLPTNAQLSMQDASGTPSMQSTPTLSNTGASVNETASAAGSNVSMTFNANAGDNLELQLNNLSVPGASVNGFRVDVYDPFGADVASTNCYTSNPGAGCRLALWNLTAGTYSVVATPTWGGTIGFSAQIEPDISGPSLVANTPATITLGSGQLERLTFNANPGDTIALNLSGVSTTLPSGQPVYVNVYRPDGGLISTSNYYTEFSETSSGIVNLQNLPVGGTYTAVVFTAYGTPGTAQLTLVSGSAGVVTTNGTVQSFATHVTGQNSYLSFNANQGDNLELQLSNISVTGGSTNAFSIDIYNSVGTDIFHGICYGYSVGSACRLPLWNLAAGTYSAIATPSWGGTINFNAQLQSDLTGMALTPNTPATVTLGSGQEQRLTFNANVGDTVALNMSGVSTTSPTGQTVYVNVYRPDTGAITIGNYYTSFSTSSSGTFNLPNLPASGTYTVVVYTADSTPATAQLTLVPGATGTVTTNGVAQSFAANVTGQNIYVSFNANTGDNLELELSNIAVTGGTGNGFHVDIYNSAGTDVSQAYCYSSNPAASCRFALWNLAAGTYSVVVSPTSGGSIGFTAQLQSDVIGPSLAMGTPATINLGAGQVQRVTFNANVGDTVALYLSGVSTTSPTGQMVYVNVYRPDVGALTPSNAYTSFSATSSALINLQNLPASGTYTAVIYTSNGTPATAQLTLEPGVTGAVTTNGPVQSFTANAPGENVYFNFNANLGDNLELQLSGVNVPGASTNELHVDIYNGAGTDISSGYCSASSPGASCRAALWNLSAGTYLVVITPIAGGTLSFTTQVQSDTTGPSLTANTPATVNLTAGGVERLTFNATVGQTVVLNLSGVSTAPAGQSIYVNVYRPDTGAITTGNSYTYFGTATSSSLTLPNLPASGTYTLVAYTSYATPATGQLSFSPQ